MRVGVCVCAGMGSMVRSGGGGAVALLVGRWPRLDGWPVAGGGWWVLG